MKTIVTSIIVLCFLYCPFYSVAQTQQSAWLADFNTVKTGKKTSIHSDFQLRSTDEVKQMQTLLLRGGLNYHLNKKWTITAGYALIINKRSIAGTGGYANEHRLWQQLIFTHKINNITTSHRLRTEQRFIDRSKIENNRLVKNGNAYANRVRYFMRNVLPLNNKKPFSRGLYAALQNELFMNVGNTKAVNGKFFDQNRFYLAAGYRIRPKADIEIGYMNQYVNGSAGQFTNNHIIQFATYLRL